MSDLNNKNLNSISNKIRKVDLLTQYITDRINDNQNIKRYIVYNTLNPLATRSKDYAGVIVNQPNITDDLSDCNGTQYIFNGMFDPDIKTEEKNMIFIHSPSSSFLGNNNRIRVDVNILTHHSFNGLNSKGMTRTGMIASEICDMFDSIYLDKTNGENYEDDIGNVKFEITGRSFMRVSDKDKTLVCRLNLEINIPTNLRSLK